MGDGRTVAVGLVEECIFAIPVEVISGFETDVARHDSMTCRRHLDTIRTRASMNVSEAGRDYLNDADVAVGLAGRLLQKRQERLDEDSGAEVAIA